MIRKMLNCLAVGVAMVASSGALAVVSVPAATASIDWSTFTYQLFSLGSPGNPAPSLTFDSGSQYTYAQAGANNASSPDWSSPLSLSDDVATASATVNPSAFTNSLDAAFTSHPAIANLSANSSRNGSFTLSANSYVVFSVNANVAIDMNVPQGGAAYAWSYMSASGPDMFGGPDTQNSTGDKIAWAQGAGMPQAASGKLIASFANLTGGDLTGNLSAFATVNSYGGSIVVVPGVPEPGSYAMMLAGVALMGVVIRRRKPAP